MNGKVRYTGTEKIERKICDDIEERMDSRFSEIAEETRMSVIQEIRDELQPETVPYDRLRLIEHRIHEIATTQDGIVREIVDLKVTLQVLAKELDKLKSPKTIEASPYSSYSMSPMPETSVSAYRPPAAEPFRSANNISYTPYDSIRPTQPPGFSNSTGPSTPISPISQAAPISSIASITPITPISFNSRKDGWEYQEFIPIKRNYAEPEKFVPAKVIPAKNDPFYFGDPEEEVIDVFPTEPAPALPTLPTLPELNVPPSPPPFESKSFTVQKIPKEQPQEKPDISEYIIGNNKKKNAELEEDYNDNCEYIIAEKNTGSRNFGNRKNRSGAEKKEQIISSDEDGTEITTYD